MSIETCSNILKQLLLFRWFITSRIALRNYGKIIYNISNKYDRVFPISKPRNLEKLSIKANKPNLEMNFLLHCRKLKVITKLLFFNLPYTNNNDAKTFRKRLLRSALPKRNHEKPQIGYRTEQLKKPNQKYNKWNRVVFTNSNNNKKYSSRQNT